MHYEILVWKGKRHVFATSARSLTSLGEAATLYRKLYSLFPAAEGYGIRVTRHVATSQDVTSEISLFSQS